MAEITLNDEFRAMLNTHGIAKTARILGCRHSTVREAAAKVGYEVRQGRPPKAERNDEIRRRYGDLTLDELAAHYKLTIGRIYQILKRR